MSRHHENIVWQSPDLTWNRGFYERLPCGGSDCEDETHEWCDDFDESAFEWVSAGHPSTDAAYRAWDGANPGSSSEMHPYEDLDERGRAEVANLEDMAAVLCEAEQERHRAQGSRAWGYGYRAYNGPTKRRSLAAIQAQREQMVRAWVSHRLGGYANMLDPREKDLNAAIKQRLATASPAEVEAYDASVGAHVSEMREMLAKHRAQRVERARSNARFGGYRYDPQAGQRQRDLNERERQVEDYIARVEASLAARIAERAVPAPPAEPVAARAPKKTAPKKLAQAPAAQARQPKGVSTGGQFAAAPRSESAVTLATPVSAADDFATWGDDPWGSAG